METALCIDLLVLIKGSQSLSAFFNKTKQENLNQNMLSRHQSFMRLRGLTSSPILYPSLTTCNDLL